MIPQAAPRRRRARVSRCAPSRSFKLYRSFQRSKEGPPLKRGPSLLSSERETLSSGHGSTNYLFFCFFLGRFRQVMQSILAAIFFLPLVWCETTHITPYLDVNHGRPYREQKTGL
jgi:hypothetical protein